MTINSQGKEHVLDGYAIKIKIMIFRKIPILKITLTKNIVRKMKKTLKMNQKIKKIEKQILTNTDNIDFKVIDLIKEFSKQINIEKLDLQIELGTENAFLTAILVAIFSSIFSIGISNMGEKRNNIKYKIEPIYHNQNFIKIAISGIFRIKVIHIINIIYVLNKKGGTKKYEHTSNRRAYDYSYE